MATIGDNSGNTDPMLDVSDEQLRSADTKADVELRELLESIERLDEEKKAVSDDIKDKFSEAKAKGYDTKIMRQILKLRKMKPDDRAEMESLLETYKASLGMK